MALHNKTLKSSTALSSLKSLPELATIHLGEAFGLITSNHASMFGGLLNVKEELAEDDAIMPHPKSLEFEHDSTADLALHASCPILKELRVDLHLLDQPQGAQHTVATGGMETITATKHKLESMSPADTVHIGGASITTKTSPLLLDVSSPPEDPLGCIEAITTKAAPLVTKRARLGSLTKLSDPAAPAPPSAHSPPKFDVTCPQGQLDYYFGTSLKATNLLSKFAANEPTLPGHNTTTVVNVPSGPMSASPASHISLTLPRCHVDGLTHSQRLFSLATNIDARSLVVKECDEFYLFMDMRTEFKWISHEMTPKRWVTAMAEYNRQLVGKCGSSAILKHPLVLLRKLGKLEPRLMNRITRGDYKYKYNAGQCRSCSCIHLPTPH